MRSSYTLPCGFHILNWGISVQLVALWSPSKPPIRTFSPCNIKIFHRTFSSRSLILIKIHSRIDFVNFNTKYKLSRAFEIWKLTWGRWKTISRPVIWYSILARIYFILYSNPSYLKDNRNWFAWIRHNPTSYHSIGAASEDFLLI